MIFNVWIVENGKKMRVYSGPNIAAAEKIFLNHAAVARPYREVIFTTQPKEAWA